MFNVIAIVIGLYTALIGGLYLIQRELIYHPSKSLPSPAISGAADMSVVRVTTKDGLTLTSWYRPAQEGQPTILYFHGNGGNIAGRGSKVRPYLDAGYGVLLVGYRGYGDNPGRPNEQGLYADGRAHLNFLKEQNIEPEQWVMYGESLGTGVAVQMALEMATGERGQVSPPARAVVLEAPFSSLADAAQAHYPYVPARYLIKDRFDSLAKIKQIKSPLLIINGDLDGVIPPDQGHRLFKAAAMPKVSHWIAGAGHNNLYDFGVARLVVAFMSKNNPAKK